MIIENNTAAEYGGGVFVRHGYTGTRNFSMDKCIIRNNSAVDGVGVYVANRVLSVFTNCLFYGNNNSDEGAALCIYDSDVTMTATLTMVNCTVADNVANGGGTDVGGVDVKGAASAKIYNSVFRSNTFRDIDNGLGANPTVGNTIYQSVGTITNAGGNLPGSNPLFVNSGSGDYRIQTGSPAINAGAAVIAGVTVPTTDLVSTSRSGNPDMGAYEQPALYPNVVNACSTDPCTPSVSVAITNVTCMNGTNGALNATITGGNCGAGDTYSWTNALGTVVSTSSSVTNLSAGTYTLTITTAVGVFVYGPYTVTQPSVTLSISGLPSSICVNANAVNISGNMAPSGVFSGTGISNAVNGTAQFNPATAGVGGPYSISYSYVYNTVCTTSISQNITVLAAPNAEAGNDVVNICSGASVQLGGSPSGSGGTGALTYAWTPSSGLSATSVSNPNANPAASQTYLLTVTDVNNCSDTDSIRVIVNPNPIADAGNVSYSICNGNSVNIGGSPTGSGGTGALTYSWSPSSGLSSSLIANPSASPTSNTTYTVTVTDSKGCTASDATLVNVNALPTLNTSGQLITQTTCNSSNGSISGLVASGAPVLSYQWISNGNVVGTSIDLTNIPSGSYSLTVTDGNGCSDNFGPFALSDLGGPVIDISGIVLQSDTCGHSAGAISGISVSGGSGMYTYSWTTNSGAVGNTLDLSDLPADDYTLQVIDASGCTSASGPFTVQEVAGPVIDASSVQLVSDTCGNLTGAFNGIQINGGTAPVLIEWSDGVAVVSTSTNPTNLPAGNYFITVTDARGCTDGDGPFTINALNAPQLDESSASASSEHCNLSDGSINGFQVSGGTGSISFNWYDGTTLIGTTQNLSGISAGNYTLVITDDAGCSDTSSLVTVPFVGGPQLDESNAISTDEICGNAAASVTGVQVVGGTNPLNFSWYSNGNLVSTSIDLTDQPGGDYQLIVSDAFGCVDSSSVFNLNSSAGLSLDASAISVSGETCSSQNGSIVGVLIVNGNNPVIAGWYLNSSLISNSIDLTNATAGNYTLIVSDANACADTLDVTVPDLAGPSIDLNLSTVTPESCDLNNGSVSGVTVNGGSGSISVMWMDSSLNVISNQLDISSLAAGNYYLTVSDTNLCSDSVMVVIDNLNGGTVLAVDDYANGNQDQLLDIFVAGNDNGDASSVAVIVNPNHGTINSVANGLVAYMPNSGYYGTDTLQYVICDAFCNNRCDTAFVYITIQQEIPIDIPNGFTPNGDGFNDYFVIVGLFQYPNNKIAIYNRWGELVYKAEPYQNNWDGKSIDNTRKIGGDQVVDGTYFFILDLGDGSAAINGFVEIKSK